MILIDANLLLYAYDESSPFHVRARAWLEGVLSGSEPVGLSWMTIVAFLRISTSARVLANPFSIGEAVSIVAEWLSIPVVTTLSPGGAHWTVFRDVLVGGEVRGPLVTDAHLAALAIEHDALLASSDGDFDQFEGLSRINPLADLA